MKVLYDYTIFYQQRYGGISTYFVEIINGLKGKPGFEALISDFVGKSIYNEEIDGFQDKKLLTTKILSKVNNSKLMPLIRRYNDYLALKKLKKNNFDILHPTYYNPYFLPYINNKPYVLTVHDMVHEMFPEQFPVNHPVVKVKKKLIDNASRIIAISHNTKKDLIRLLNVPSDKIDVVYHGVNFGNITDLKAPFTLPKSFVLYVGERKTYKNFSNFIHAFAKLNAIIPDLKLICTGHAFSDQYKDLFADLKITNSVLHRFAKDNQELAYLYKNAKCFVYPSLYEGFGIPILEAFSCNCPVVLSDASCFPEIAADAAEYFDPASIESIFNSIHKVLTDDDHRLSLVVKGTKRVRDFSWEKSAKETYDVYNKVLSLQ